MKLPSILGSAWKRTSEEKGTEYFRLSISLGGLIHPLDCTVVRNPGKDDEPGKNRPDLLVFFNPPGMREEEKGVVVGSLWSRVAEGSGRTYYAGELHPHRFATVRLPGGVAVDFSLASKEPLRLKLCELTDAKKRDRGPDWILSRFTAGRKAAASAEPKDAESEAEVSEEDLVDDDADYAA